MTLYCKSHAYFCILFSNTGLTTSSQSVSEGMAPTIHKYSFISHQNTKTSFHWYNHMILKEKIILNLTLGQVRKAENSLKLFHILRFQWKLNLLSVQIHSCVLKIQYLNINLIFNLNSVQSLWCVLKLQYCITTVLHENIGIAPWSTDFT